MDRWKLIASDTVVSNRWLRILNNRYESEGRPISDYFVVQRSDFVLVVAVDADDRLLLVRQYRPATDSFYVSLPAGYVADGEAPLDAARRELLEETGSTGHDWRRLGQLDPLPGYIRSRAYVFRCDVDASSSRPSPSRADDDDELVEPLVMSRAAVREMIVDGSITEMQAVAAILLADAVEAARLT